MISVRGSRSRRAAFTLFEILLVVALLGLLATVAIVNVDRLFQSSSEDITRTFVTTSMKAPLTTYRYHMGTYPSTAEGLQALLTAPGSAGDRWKGPYLDTPGNQLPVDPWRHPYQYRYPGTKNPGKYDLFSFGPDGVESGDDIGNW